MYLILNLVIIDLTSQFYAYVTRVRRSCLSNRSVYWLKAMFVRVKFMFVDVIASMLFLVDVTF